MTSPDPAESPWRATPDGKEFRAWQYERLGATRAALDLRWEAAGDRLAREIEDDLNR